MSQPFLDDRLMNDSSPGCSLRDFQQPCLRRCPVDISTLCFTGRINPNPDPRAGTAGLDGGLDGYNWKVGFGETGPLVL